MAILQKRVHRDTIIWLGILAGHGFLLVMLMRSENRRSVHQPVEAAPAMSYVWLLPRESESAREVTHAPRTRSSSRLPVALFQQPLSSPSPGAAPPQTVPRVDWFREGQVAAATAARNPGTNGKQETFTPLPKGLRKPCQSPKSSMEWQPSRVGMTGTDGGLHLPFVKLGKRCVIGLGFFGCNLDELPEPNVHLLDDMHDPDRSRTSVPAVDACD